jgi:hypothetical protein
MTTTIENTRTIIENTQTSVEPTIFRFKFSDEFTSQLIPFAKLHQYDDRHMYKEEWTRWVTNNDELIDTESRRLKSLGYDGDIHDKMYKSGRYYFRNKTEHTVKTRRKYISLEHEILGAMDEHLSVNYHMPHFKPATAYDQFCIEYKDVIQSEVERISEENHDGMTKDDILLKMKKTYKNRYYLFKQNQFVRRNEDDECNEVNNPDKPKE